MDKMTIQQNYHAMKENDPVGYAVKVAEMTEKKEQLQASASRKTCELLKSKKRKMMLKCNSL